MAQTLQNASIQLSVDPGHAYWSVYNRQNRGLGLEGAQIEVNYRRGALTSRIRGGPLQPGAPKKIDSPQGLLQQISFDSAPDKNGLFYTVTFALPEDYPFLLWKMSLHNPTNQPVSVGSLEMLNVGFIPMPRSSGWIPVLTGEGYGIPQGAIRPGATPGDFVFYSNGWQSWNYTGVYGPRDYYRCTRLGPIAEPMRINAGTPHHKRRGVFASDMFAVLGERKQRTGILVGFLSQEEQFGTIEALIGTPEPAIRMWANGDGARLDRGSVMETDWACLTFVHLDAPDPMCEYLEAVARQNGLAKIPGQNGAGGDFAASINGKRAEVPFGWCSWYQFYQKVTSKDILENLRLAAEKRGELPLDMIQIDDGFEAQIGDWSSFSPAFSEGVAPLADEIRRSGFTPGLWLAPFILHPGARLFREHPDWILRGRWGRPVNAGFAWDVFDTALDITIPEALNYAAEAVHRAAHEWGFPFLKLDFLYAAALPGRYHDPTKTRAQVLRMGLKALRQAAGEETHLLGCGCPLGPAIGLVDSMRVSSDVAPRWNPAYFDTEFFFKPEPDMPAARNSIHNSLTRAPLHRRWWVNDPDCLLVRQNSRLTLAEVQTLATVVAFCGGTMLLSDDLTKLSPERMRIAQALLPLIGKRPVLPGWFDSSTPERLQLNLNGECGSWSLLALFNWENKPCDLAFNVKDFYLDVQAGYLARSFWDGQVFRIQNGSSIFRSVPAHGVVLLALRANRISPAQYLGSDLHISQGMEVSSWNASPQGVALTLNRPGSAQGGIDLSLSGEPRQALLNGSAIQWEAKGESIYRFAVEFNNQADLQITL